ncbi:MAG: phosphate signaling complex protein PhoU [Verrucomicrobiales bacterium]
MAQQLDQYLREIHSLLEVMFGLADRNLSIAIRALEAGDQTLAKTVVSEDSQLDELEMEVDEKVVNHITRGPVASDARFMLVASKISSNYERIADQAEVMARTVLRIESQLQDLERGDVIRMAFIAREMMAQGHHAFVQQNKAPLNQIIARDEEVDSLYWKVMRQLGETIFDRPHLTDSGLHLLIAARAIERLADHAKNVAEEVFYWLEARDIRHGK